MEQQKQIDNVIWGLSVLSKDIELHGVCNLLETNVVSETFYGKLFNIIYGLELDVVNIERSNYAGIDLIDKKNKIIIQVSSISTMDKIKKSIERVDVQKYLGYNYRYISIVKDANNLRNGKYNKIKYLKFNPEVDVSDIFSLSRELLSTKFTNEQLEALNNLFRQNLGIGFSDDDEFDSYILEIIDCMASEEVTDDAAHIVVDEFEISKKIGCNNLERRKPYLMSGAMQSYKINKIYGNYEASGKSVEYYVSNYVRRLYLRAPDINSECDLLDHIVDSIVEEIYRSKGKHRRKEIITLCVDAIVADAFMKCKIFKHPSS